jgi:hypothetical protein
MREQLATWSRDEEFEDEDDVEDFRVSPRTTGGGGRAETFDFEVEVGDGGVIGRIWLAVFEEEEEDDEEEVRERAFVRR